MGVFAILGLAGSASALPVSHASGYTGQEQMNKARQLEVAHQEALAPLAQQLFAKKSDLAAQLDSATPDTAKIESLSRDIGEIMGKIRSAEVSFSAEMAKEGITVNGRCAGYNNMMAHGYGHGGGHGGGYGGYGGGHGGGHW